MNAQEKEYFDALVKSRWASYRATTEPHMRGIWKRIIEEQYSDKAHFIYELLQNADDAGATQVHFILRANNLIFAHNGTRSFSISNPETEEEDGLNGTLGDLNSITSIGHSGKDNSFLDNTPRIGKFGIGFKAVFAYTCTPRIYSKNLNFQLSNYIVPTLLDNVHPELQTGETLFDFPFDNPKCSPLQAFEDIKQKLQSLVTPTLFLNNLKKITYSIDNDNESIDDIYENNVEQEGRFEDIIYELINLNKSNVNPEEPCKLWKFTKNDDCYKYSVGFYVNNEGKLIPYKQKAFCFFPTTVNTGLNFIIHAPFLVTNNRGEIPAGEPHNQKMIQLLAKLSADAIVCLRDIGINNNERLIDDGILDIIPYDRVSLYVNGIEGLSFTPFYDEIHEKFKQEDLLPTLDGYVGSEHAYWSDAASYIEIFDDNKLMLLTNNSEAKWVFRSRGRNSTYSKDHNLAKYVDELIVDWFSDEDILGKISSVFIEKQTVDWLKILYGFISSRDLRIKVIKNNNLPIFLNQKQKANKLFLENSMTHAIFLPPDDSEKEDICDDYMVISPEVYKFQECKELAQKLGIHHPSLKDEIESKIIPLYPLSNISDLTIKHFRKFLKYYQECPAYEQKSFVKKISSLAFLISYNPVKNNICLKSPNDIYYPTDNLCEYFKDIDNIYFLKKEEYQKALNNNIEDIENFLIDLGVSWHPKRVKILFSEDVAKELELPMEKSSDYHKEYIPTWGEFFLQGLIEAIYRCDSLPVSVIIWNELCTVYHYERERHSFKNNNEFLAYFHSYFKYQCERFSYKPNGDFNLLKYEPWLITKDGKFKSLDNITKEEFANEYDLSLPGAADILALFEVQDRPSSKQTNNSYPPEVIELLERLRQYEELEIDLNDLKLQQIIKKYNSRKVSNLTREDLKTFHDEINDKNQDEFDENDSYNSEIDQSDIDDLSHAIDNIDKNIENVKKQSIKKVDNLTTQKRILDNLEHQSKYSYGWFKSLLELEICYNDELDTHNSADFSISFNQVFQEEGTQRTLILKQPDRTIPLSIEDCIEDISLELHFSDSNAPDRSLPIEVINVRSFILRVKLKDSNGLTGIPWKQITSATINVKNPIFLLEELYKHFNGLKFDDDYDMKNHLPENISFVFGPPGTGKTTYISTKISELINQDNDNQKLHILVLAPTNKAADVITKRILLQENISDCPSWLIRFGSTHDESIQYNQIYKEHNFDFSGYSRSVVITTIARFSYDTLLINDKKVPISAVEWDYIIIDEASMIPLVTIFNVIYHVRPQKFIIAGDPFQIEPISKLKDINNENIYTCVELSSFANPKTVPYQYPVIKLTTQYRSIPSIGNIFSLLTYDGILKHNRSEEEQCDFKLLNLQLKALNIIKFPVSKYESIYRSKQLNKSSSFHIYTALFSFEFLKYLIKNLKFNETEGGISIGIITPYAAQANIIERLVNTIQLPKTITVIVGTIHSFQGDECNIIIDVFNPPPSITANSEMFLNNKNKINVSISRARDYLFILMPDDATNAVENLFLLKKLEKICKSGGSWQELHSSQVENILFGNEHYLEDNSFTTGHQSVNVYEKPEHRYEVRCEDSAVDVQVLSNTDSE